MFVLLLQDSTNHLALCAAALHPMAAASIPQLQAEERALCVSREETSRESLQAYIAFFIINASVNQKINSSYTPI